MKDAVAKAGGVDNGQGRGKALDDDFLGDIEVARQGGILSAACECQRVDAGWQEDGVDPRAGIRSQDGFARVQSGRITCASAIRRGVDNEGCLWLQGLCRLHIRLPRRCLLLTWRLVHYVETASFPAPRRACSVEAMISGRASRPNHSLHRASSAGAGPSACSARIVQNRRPTEQARRRQMCNFKKRKRGQLIGMSSLTRRVTIRP